MSSFILCWLPFHTAQIATGLGIDVTDRQCDLINQVAYGLVVQLKQRSSRLFRMTWTQSILNPLLYGMALKESSN